MFDQFFTSTSGTDQGPSGPRCPVPVSKSAVVFPLMPQWPGIQAKVVLGLMPAIIPRIIECLKVLRAATTLAESVKTTIGLSAGCVEATKTAAASAEKTLHRLAKLSEFVGSDPETPEPTPRLETEPSVYRISWLRNRVAVSSRTDLLSSSVLYPLLKRWWSRYWREATPL